MEAPADVNQYTEAHWRRCPAKPVTVLIDSTNPSRPLLSHTPHTDHSGSNVRRRSGHGKAMPQSWRISALAGRMGRLRACHDLLTASMF